MTRGARDGLNSALNYGYGILYGQMERALVLAGLDPYAGFIHADRPGKPSLTLDLIEEFRQPVVDRTVLGLANKGFEFKQDEDGLLAEDTRRALAEKVLERLEESTERYEGKKQALRVIIQSQARHLATFVRGDRADYEPFRAVAGDPTCAERFAVMQTLLVYDIPNDGRAPKSPMRARTMGWIASSTARSWATCSAPIKRNCSKKIGSSWASGRARSTCSSCAKKTGGSSSKSSRKTRNKFEWQRVRIRWQGARGRCDEWCRGGGKLKWMSRWKPEQ